MLKQFRQMKKDIAEIKATLAGMRRMRVNIQSSPIIISGFSFYPGPTVGEMKASGNDFVLNFREK